jgi:hypothetical protein
MSAREAANRRTAPRSQAAASPPASSSPTACSAARRAAICADTPSRSPTDGGGHDHDGAEWRLADDAISSPMSSAMPQVPRPVPRLAPRQRLAQHEGRDERGPDGHGVREDGTAAGGHLLHAEQHERIPAGDVEQGQHGQARPPPRWDANDVAADLCDQQHPDRGERQRQPRNVSGASSVTPILRTGQLQPQTSVRMAIGSAARANGCDSTDVVDMRAL